MLWSSENHSFRLPPPHPPTVDSKSKSNMASLINDRELLSVNSPK